MLKIGIVGGTGISHAKVFSGMFNGYDKRLTSKRKDWPSYNIRIKGVCVTHLWDENKKKKDALLLAKICGIENVVQKKEDMIGKVDGVIIADDCTMKHQKKAIPFLKAGLPIFIDKPLSPDIKEAGKLIELSRKYNAPMMSCSALRYAKETKKIREGKDNIGKILTGSTICGGDLVFYGIHALESLYSIIGLGIKSVRNLGSKGKDMVLIKYRDGRNFILITYENLRLFQVNLYGTKSDRSSTVKDGGYFYSEMMRHFVKMVKTKKEPFSPEETLEIIKVLALGKKSRKNGKEIYL